MEQTTQNILLAELYSASAYIDRIFHTLLNVTNLGHGPTAKKIGSDLNFELNKFTQEEILQKSFLSGFNQNADLKQIKNTVEYTKTLLESIIKLGHGQEQTINSTVKFINFIYDFSHDLHQYIEQNADLEIQYPRVNLIEIHYDHDDSFEEHLSSYQEDNWEDEESVPRFHLNKTALLEVISTSYSPISNLDWQRNKKYDQLLQDGHEAVFKKDLDKALELFTKAMNFKETAEILTLVAWVHSMKQGYEKAKSLCLKAIQKDPDYGPPYNDLGTYLLSEGQVDESLKWFNLAKKAINYQNREYPYINSGRAWMAKKNFEKALDEFSKALTLAPFHEELHQTVEKLKKSLRNNDSEIFPTEPSPI
ncbi:MAG: tetratricopeptide repeat protein [Bacteriovoracaceae bacterium]|nr:tetratricopeptide repeat protein [Bacteriovoracaceae bacterium]